jgi:hypothetical protein
VKVVIEITLPVADISWQRSEESVKGGQRLRMAMDETLGEFMERVVTVVGDFVKTAVA